MGNFCCGSGVRQTEDGVTISVHEATKHYEDQILKKLNLQTGEKEPYPFWKTTFPEDVAHLGPGVSIYFHHLKLFGAYYSLMSVFAIGICLLCMEVSPDTNDFVISASIGNLWKHHTPPDGVIGGLDFLMMATFLLMCYLLPTKLKKKEEDCSDADAEESPPARKRENSSKGRKDKDKSSDAEDPATDASKKKPRQVTFSSQPRAVTFLPSQFTVRIGSIQPQKNLDILIKELWDFGEIVEMCVVLSSGKVLLIHFANGNIDPICVQEMQMSDYKRGQVPIDKYGQHYKATEARVEAALREGESQPLLKKPIWSSTNLVLPDALLCYVTYLRPESAVDCLKALKGCPCWCNCLAFNGWTRGLNMTATHPKEPSDILWANLTYSWGNRMLRRLLSIIISVALVSLNVFTLFNIQKYKNTHQHIPTAEAIVLGLIVVCINEFLKFAMRVLAYLERHYSYSGLDTSIARSKFIVEVANNIFIIVLLFGIPGSSDNAGWYDSGAMVVIAILASDAVVPNLVQLFHPKTRLMRCYKFYTAKSQRELNVWYEEPKMELWVRFTGLLGSNFIALWFASAVPMILPLAAIAVGFQFLTEKYNVLRQYQRPAMLDTSMAVFVRHMAPWAVVFHCAFALLVYRSPKYEKMFELQYWGHWKLADFGKFPVLTEAQWPILALIPITILFIVYVYGGSLWILLKSCCCGGRKSKVRGNFRKELARDCESYTREVQKAFCYTQPVQIYPPLDDPGVAKEEPDAFDS